MESAVAIPLWSLTLKCQYLRGVWLCSVNTSVESDCAVSKPPWSLTLQCQYLRGVWLCVKTSVESDSAVSLTPLSFGSAKHSNSKDLKQSKKTGFTQFWLLGVYAHRGVRMVELHDRISRRNRNLILKYFLLGDWNINRITKTNYRVLPFCIW